MNILVTAIGSFSTTEVIRSLQANDKVKKIYGCDVYPADWHYVSREFHDVFRAPYVSNGEEYFDFVNKVIKSYNIDVIIPLTDLEVDFFNDNRHHFSDLLITIGSPEFIAVARNKELLNRFLQHNNFPNIPTYSFEELDQDCFPVIGKPKDGRSSEGIVIANQFGDLNQTASYSNYIFQRFVKGDIFTLDVLRNHDTTEIVVIPRKELLRTKNGAGITVKILYQDELVKQASHISEKVGGHGAFNMEFIATDSTNYLIDINPRFSAGIGFSALAGYDIVKNMLNVFFSNPIDKLYPYKEMIIQKNMVEVINKIL